MSELGFRVNVKDRFRPGQGWRRIGYETQCTKRLEHEMSGCILSEYGEWRSPDLLHVEIRH